MYCKEPLGTEVWLAIRNPNYCQDYCPYCGKKVDEVDNRRYIVVDGIFDAIQYDDNVLFLVEYLNPVTDRFERTVVSHRYFHLEDKNIIEEMMNHSIFDLQYAYDEGDYAFATQEEAKEWIKEFYDD